MLDHPDRAAQAGSSARLLALAVGFGVCLYFADEILGFLVRPLRQAFPDGEGQLIFTKLPEVFFVELKVALFAGFMVSFPVIANQLWAFVAPAALRAREKGVSALPDRHPGCCFSAGASLAYFVVMPTAFVFFLGFGGEAGGMQVPALPSAGDYLSLVMQFILAFGLTFLLPVLPVAAAPCRDHQPRADGGRAALCDCRHLRHFGDCHAARSGFASDPRAAAFCCCSRCHCC